VVGGGYGTDTGFSSFTKGTFTMGKVQGYSEENMNMFWVGFPPACSQNQRYKGGEMTRHELGMHLQLLNPKPIMTGIS